MNGKESLQEMLPKSSVQDRFAIDRNKLWRDYFVSHELLRLAFFWVVFYLVRWVAFGEILFEKRLWLIRLIGGVCAGSIVMFLCGYRQFRQIIESYFFDVTNDFIIVVAKNISSAVPLLAVHSVIAEKQFLTGDYRVKIKSHMSRRPLLIMGFDEKTALALQEYISEKVRIAQEQK